MLTMLKRFAACIVTLCLLAGCCMPLTSHALTKSERYGALLEQLHCYFDGDDCMLLEDFVLQFEALGNYKKSVAFSYYVRVLRDVENETYEEIGNLVEWMRLDATFAELLEEEEFPTVDEVTAYALGRQAQFEGDTATALAWYSQCISVLDALMRYADLEGSDMASRYQQALNLLRQDTARSCEQAVGLLTPLAQRQYLDSEELLAQAQRRFSALVTPVPTPAPTPSPTPRITPSPLNLVATSSTGGVALRWDSDPAGGVTYIVERYTSSGWAVRSSEIRTTRFNEVGLASGSSYSYRVTAYRDGAVWAVESCSIYTQSTPRPTATPRPTSTPRPANDFPIGRTCWVWVPDNGRARSGPGTNYAFVDYVYYGDVYTVLDRQMGNTGKDWYKVRLSDGRYGWISSGLVTIDGNSEGTAYGVPIIP